VIVAVPGFIAVTTPDADPTVATAALLLAHVPPTVALLNTVVFPAHTFNVPEIGAIYRFTVTVFVAFAVPQLFDTV
jgi:hypothetical protein